MRRKIITDSAITSRKLAGLSDFAERVYWRVYLKSDNYGTMSGDPWDVWHQCVPGVRGATEKKVAVAVADLVNVGLLESFEEKAKPWLHVLDHDRHQSKEFLRKRGDRRTPVPPSQKDTVLDDEIMRAEGAKAGPAPAKAGKGRRTRAPQPQPQPQHPSDNPPTPQGAGWVDEVQMEKAKTEAARILASAKSIGAVDYARQQIDSACAVTDYAAGALPLAALAYVEYEQHTPIRNPVAMLQRFMRQARVEPGVNPVKGTKACDCDDPGCASDLCRMRAAMKAGAA